MYLHLGGEKIIRSKELIGIFDLSVEKSSKLFKEFITYYKENNLITAISDEEPKSLVITENNLYYSPVSPATLRKRVNHGWALFNS